jgi:acid phosphatase type 7
VPKEGAEFIANSSSPAGVVTLVNRRAEGPQLWEGGRMRKTTLLLASMSLAVVLSCTTVVLTAVPVAGQTTTVTLVGAGDIASCSYDRDEATANVLANVSGTVFTLGDNLYPDGTAAQFANCYDNYRLSDGSVFDATRTSWWGRYKARTKPAVGNHEYHTPEASGYLGYFGARAGNPAKGYYTYKRGSWRIIVLNSNCSAVGGCGELSPQGGWLEKTLTKYPARCTLAYFHHPLFASTGAASPEVRPFWNILDNHNADVILSGHAHYYERFAPQLPDGTRDESSGIREFVVGTGGAPPENPMTSPRAANSVIDSEKSPGVTAYGVLKLRLSAGSYTWKFLPVAGEIFTDSGTGQCH